MRIAPSELIFDEFEDQVFRGHPLGHAILGTEGSVGRIGVEVQRRFFREHYRPEGMVLFAQGDISWRSSRHSAHITSHR